MRRSACVLFLCFLSFFLFSEGFRFSGGVGFSYMNHYAFSRYKVDSAFKTLLDNELNALTKGDATIESTESKRMYNSMMVGLDLKAGKNFTYNEFGGYLSVNIGLPYTVNLVSPSPMDFVLKSTEQTKLVSSFITDTQTGFYINLFSQSPVQLYIGTGVAFNWIRTTRELHVSSLADLTKSDGSSINISSIDNISEQSNIKMLGFGINIGLTYYFSNSIGLFFSLNNSCYFKDMGSDSSLVGRLSNGQSFNYKIAKDGKIGNANVASFGRNSFANNFGAKVGFAFRI